jgi:hypothetical protein
MTAKRNKILTVFIGLVLSSSFLTISAQDKSLSQHDRIYLFLRDSSENLVGTGCGYAGVTTINIEYTKLLLKDNRADLLIKLLESNIPATKYLAIQALLLIDPKQVDSLTTIKIMELKKSKQSIPVCLGCVLGYSYSIDNLLNDKKNNTGKSIRKYLADRKE